MNFEVLVSISKRFHLRKKLKLIQISALHVHLTVNLDTCNPQFVFRCKNTCRMNSPMRQFSLCSIPCFVFEEIAFRNFVFS